MQILYKVIMVVGFLAAHFYPAVATSNDEVLQDGIHSVSSNTAAALSMVTQIKAQTPPDN
ncbi:hypothetical protein ACT9XH_04785 [Methanococcoides methylutens]|uniref:hypothetical protein n=1 Tax=Methanococcoides methylutens TaxID=2226 RepID=UPI004044D7C2